MDFNAFRNSFNGSVKTKISSLSPDKVTSESTTHLLGSSQGFTNKITSSQHDQKCGDDFIESPSLQKFINPYSRLSYDPSSPNAFDLKYLLTNSADVQNQVVNTDLYKTEQNNSSRAEYLFNNYATEGKRKTFKPKIVAQNEPTLMRKQNRKLNTTRNRGQDKLEV